jgi:hypothetical protein
MVAIIKFGKVSSSLDPSCKIETNGALNKPTLSVFYIHESWTLGKPYGIKVRCYCECLGSKQLEILGNLMGT